MFLEGLKKVVLKFWFVNNIVIVFVNIGKDKSNKKVVIKID